MTSVKYLILGAGPAGLSFANKLKQRNEESFIVLEKEKEAGGLCRSAMVDGSFFDIGGGHFLDVRRPEVTSFLFDFMPESEWNIFERDSRIDLKGNIVHHPLEANIWELPPEIQEEYLASIKAAGCNNKEAKPERFIEWILWKLGDRIADDYMIPYNKKMFADELDELGTYWLEKLPNVNFEETLKSCEDHKAYGTQPGHAQFYYPQKYGYGELFLRMAERIKDKIIYNAEVSRLDVADRTVYFENDAIKADCIITTIPWTSFSEISNISEEKIAGINNLKHSGIETRYVAENLDTAAQWIYVPDENKPYHRILVRHNFCTNSRGYWFETRKERVALFDSKPEFAYLNEYAYPLNTVGKPEIMDALLNDMSQYKIYGLGRWGEHSHFNSDVVVERAIRLSEKI